MTASLTNREFSTPFSLLLGFIWLVGAFGSALMLWASDLLHLVERPLNLLSMPIELAVRRGHSATDLAHPGWLLVGLSLTLISLAAAIFLALRNDCQH